MFESWGFVFQLSFLNQPLKRHREVLMVPYNFLGHDKGSLVGV